MFDYLRQEGHISRRGSPNASGGALEILHLKPPEKDIRRYLEMKLLDDRFPYEMDPELKWDIMEDIPEKISEM